MGLVSLKVRHQKGGIKTHKYQDRNPKQAVKYWMGRKVWLASNMRDYKKFGARGKIISAKIVKKR